MSTPFRVIFSTFYFFRIFKPLIGEVVGGAATPPVYRPKKHALIDIRKHTRKNVKIFQKTIDIYTKSCIMELKTRNRVNNIIKTEESNNVYL